MVKGFALNDDRFINGNRFETRYFDELLERIKVIRTSERMSYQKITENDWILTTDKLLKFRGKKVLKISGKISHKRAIEKAENVYEKFRIIQDSDTLTREFFYDYSILNSELKLIMLDNACVYFSNKEIIYAIILV